MDFVEQLKTQVDIVRTISEYVRLKKASGNRYQGLCPFHNEKSPSFSVWVDIQAYKCFGCGESGDLFKFIQKIEGVTFVESLKILAERNGIEMPKRTDQSDPDTKLRAALFTMHEIALRLFMAGLRSPTAQAAREYLGKRGLTPAQADEFGLGFSDPNGQALTKRLQQEGFTIDQLEASALVRRRDDGSFYDAFRGRLMFPIHDEAGRVVAFGGRTLKDDEQPKYLNSAGTPVYQKSRVLYNLNRAKNAIRKVDHSILVEGYMDVIGVYSAEVHEVVASCGTALTNDQVRSLKRHSDKIVVNFDPDNAGAKAAERSIQMLLEEGMHIKVLELEGKLDPDEYIAEHGAEHYRYKLQHAASYFGWLADRSRRQFDMSTAEGRMQGFQYLLPAIQRVHDKLERLTIANEMAAYLGVKDTEVLEHLRRSPTGTKQSEGPKLPQVPPLEKLLVRILIRNTEARDEMLPRMRGGQMRTARIVDAIRAAARPGQDLTFTEIDSQLDEGNKNLLHSMAFADDTDESNLTLEQAWLCWQKIQMGDRQARRMQLKAGIEAAEREKRFNDALQLIKELSELEREPE